MTENLNTMQLDALREIGNIGAGNAATALAQLLNRKINMSVPWAGLIPFTEITTRAGKEEELVACVNTKVEGPAAATILFLLDSASTFLLVDMLLGRSAGETTELGELEQSTLTEVGNILTGSFLAAFAQMTQMSFIPSVPAFAFDMLAAVLSSALITSGYVEDQILVMETTFFNEQTKINSHFFLVPRPGALEVILQALGFSF